MTAPLLAHSDLRDLVDDIFGSLFSPAPIDVEAALAAPSHAVTGWVDIDGGWVGRVLVCTTETGATEIAAALLDLPASRVVDADLTDAIGELANIVGGSVKSCVAEHSTLSLPRVRHGSPDLLPADGLEVAALWNDHPLLVRVVPKSDRPIPGSRQPERS